MNNEVIFSKKGDILKSLVQVCAELRGQIEVYEKPTLPRTELEMMLLTIASESSFKDRKQIGGGPARGLCGMEPATVLDTFRWLERKPEAWQRLTYIWMGLRSVPYFSPDKEEVSEHLAKNDPFALAIGRLHYRMFEEAFPTDLVYQARYWKQYWNTEGGAGTPNFAINQWKACKCDGLMEEAAELCHFQA